MKSAKYRRRFYRDWTRLNGLYLTDIVNKETDLQILTNKPVDEDFLKERIREYRFAIENYITKDRRFLTSLSPIAVELNSPAIVKEMSKTAKLANVGPMAAVAGAIAEFLGRDLIKKGYKDVLIENGGDIFLKTTKIRKIGIYAGRSKLWNNLSLKVMPRKTAIGICTSSGTVGHSLSFGKADSVIIIAKSASLADAVATATGNLVKSKDDFKKALAFAKGVSGVLGVAIIIKDIIISWGDIEFFAG